MGRMAVAEFDDDNKLIVTPRTRGKGRLLREDLRSLPGDLVTDAIAEGDKVHELDDEHTKLGLIEDYKLKQTQDEDEEAAASSKEDPVRGRLTEIGQRGVDEIRIRVYKAVLNTCIKRLARGYGYRDGVGEKLHLWFPEDRATKYELRKGNAPAPSERPRHLRRLQLEIDPQHLPRRLADTLAARKDPALFDILKATLLVSCRVKPTHEDAMRVAHKLGRVMDASAQ